MLLGVFTDFFFWEGFCLDLGLDVFILEAIFIKRFLTKLKVYIKIRTSYSSLEEFQAIQNAFNLANETINES